MATPLATFTVRDRAASPLFQCSADRAACAQDRSLRSAPWATFEQAVHLAIAFLPLAQRIPVPVKSLTDQPSRIRGRFFAVMPPPRHASRRDVQDVPDSRS